MTTLNFSVTFGNLTADSHTCTVKHTLTQRHLPAPCLPCLLSPMENLGWLPHSGQPLLGFRGTAPHPPVPLSVMAALETSVSAVAHWAVPQCWLLNSCIQGVNLVVMWELAPLEDVVRLLPLPSYTFFPLFSLALGSTISEMFCKQNLNLETV